MNKFIFLIVFVGMAQLAAAQSRSIGIRLGEPTGITYKNYFSKGRAFELGIGSAGSGWNHNYYENSFDKKSNGYYTSHRVSNIVYLQARYLLNYEVPVNDVEGRFDWYWGVGAVLKFARVEYYYQNETPPYGPFAESRTDIDFGPEGILGAEYKFEDVPITLFVEGSLMMEFADRFGAFRGFIGTGARYHF